MAFTADKDTQIETGVLTFKAEARLLQELGERLVAVPEVALVELIKNAYDADTMECEVVVDEKNGTLSVQDDGHGMTLKEFENFWMTIGTSHKAKKTLSPKFKRDLTGQKGIGRFAVRFLGAVLHIETVAYDLQKKHKTRVAAKFDWAKLDVNGTLSATKVPYQVLKVSSATKTGTLLTMSKLRHDTSFTQSSSFRTQVLRIISPVQGLDSDRFQRTPKSNKKLTNEDPGFRVALPGSEPAAEVNLAEEALNNCWAKLVVDVEKDKVRFEVTFQGEPKAHKLQIKRANAISNGLHADIRWFPRRKGIFLDKNMDGRAAWGWISENSGVAIVDRGFRIRPYGDPDDDWLDLVRDANTNRREWRSDIALEKFAMTSAVKNDPAVNPMLNLPANHQLIGAVFVASSKSVETTEVTDLIPSTDREGFLRTPAFSELKNIIRAGLEWLAHLDRNRQLEEREKDAREAANSVRKDFREALKFVEKIPTLSKNERTRIVHQYTELAVKLDEVEEYDREARRKLSVMGSMGVIAGFLTHEASRLKASLQEATRLVEQSAKKDPTLRSVAEELRNGVQTWQSQIEYIKAFVDATQQFKSVSFKAAPQIKRVTNLFAKFCDDRSIDVKYAIPGDIMVPAMPVSVYSGIFLNLFTNALKAVLAHENTSAKQVIEIRGFSDHRHHVVEVLDTGIGIPPSMRKRIWDPLFTTTSRMDSPLGTGMGLGLTLTKQLVEQVGGEISVVDAPSEFSTSFRVSFPFKSKS